MGGSSAAISHKSYDGNAPPNGCRDVLNKPLDASDLLKAFHFVHSNNNYDSSDTKLSTATTAILSTTHGDITIKLFPKETPTTIQNFIGHAQSGYYDNVIFHRIITPWEMVRGENPFGERV
eukprot:CCRYP_013546-RA/>CCRYP_013546-RA protein AED:0.40 eAED:0.63 QI:0/-1/0/1/-1/1/1/0/120